MARAAKPYRHRFEVLRDESGAWCFVNADTQPGKVVKVLACKRDAVWWAAQDLSYAWEQMHIRSELTIKRADGTIQDKRTFGEDPRRTRG